MIKPKIGYYILWTFKSYVDGSIELIYGQIRNIVGNKLFCKDWYNFTYKKIEFLGGYITHSSHTQIFKTKDELNQALVLEAL